MFLLGMLFSFSSCITTGRHDNGKHYGWNKKHDKRHYDSNRTIVVYEQDHHNYKAPKSKKESKSKKSNKKH